jgi:hypothetical protein
MGTGFERYLALLADEKLSLADVEDSLVGDDDRELRARSALTRYINRDVLAILADRPIAEPEYDRFRDKYLQPAPAADEPFYRLPKDDLERLSRRWRSLRRAEKKVDEADLALFKRINEALVEYFRGLGGDWACDVLYHSLPLLPEDERRKAFLEQYNAADEAFRLARCSELLAILADSPVTKDSDGVLLYAKKQRRLNARLEFADDHYGTLRYLDRTRLHDDFEAFLDAESDDKDWILQLLATGGMGKTMFVRWMLARKCVLDGIPCARLDFDDLVNIPCLRGWEIVTRFLSQFIRQVPDSSLSFVETELKDLSEKLRGTSGIDVATADETALNYVSRIADALHSQTSGAVLLVLDTTEEAVLRNKADIPSLFAILKSIHDAFPQLRVVLSGRIDLSDDAPGNLQVLEIGPFKVTESEQYLAQRGLGDDPRVDAVVKKSGGIPVKLSLFADLLQSGSEITTEEILEQDTIDILYLIERIIKRIEDPAVRWLVRYGALAKHLSIEFLDKVILKFVRDAREGRIDVKLDNPALDSQYLPASLRDERLYDWSDSGHVPAVKTLWDKLKKYANQSSWVRVPKDAPDCLSFHEVVVRPMRTLVSEYLIFDSVHDAAIKYYTGQITSADQGDAIVQARRALLFHQFQRHGDAASEQWQVAYYQWKDRDPQVAQQLAEEITEPDYLDDQTRLPVRLFGDRQIISHKTLAAAFLEQARLAVRLHRWGAVQKLLKQAREQEELAKTTVLPAHTLAVIEAELAWSQGRNEDTLSIVAEGLANESLPNEAVSRLQELRGDALESLRRDGVVESFNAGLKSSDDSETQSRIAMKLVDHNLRIDQYADAVRIGNVWPPAKQTDESAIDNIRMTARALQASGQPQAACRMLNGLSPQGRSPEDVQLQVDTLHDLGLTVRFAPADWTSVQPDADSHYGVLASATEAALMHRFQSARDAFQRLQEDGVPYELRARALARQARMELRDAGSLYEAKRCLSELHSITLGPRDPAKIAGRLMWAALFHAWDDDYESRSTIDDLKAQADNAGFGPGTKARIEMAYLISTSPKDPESHLRELTDQLRLVQGETARAKLLNEVEPYRGWPDRLAMDETGLNELLPIGEDVLEGLAALDRGLYCLRAARAHYVLGSREMAREALEIAGTTFLNQGVFLPMREVYQARDYLTDRQDVALCPEGWQEVQKLLAEEPPFRFTVLLEHAERLYGAGYLAAARELRDQLQPLIDELNQF